MNKYGFFSANPYAGLQLLLVVMQKNSRKESCQNKQTPLNVGVHSEKSCARTTPGCIFRATHSLNRMCMKSWNHSLTVWTECVHVKSFTTAGMLFTMCQPIRDQHHSFHVHYPWSNTVKTNKLCIGKNNNNSERWTDFQVPKQHKGCLIHF